MRRVRLRIVMWYMIVRIATGGPKLNENEDVTQEKKKMRVLRAMDVPVRVIMFSARVWSVVGRDAIGVTGAETLEVINIYWYRKFT